jgi:hypothetical protein
MTMRLATAHANTDLPNLDRRKKWGVIRCIWHPRASNPHRIMKILFCHCKMAINDHMINVDIIPNNFLTFRHVIVAWTIIVPLFFFAAIAGLGAVSLLRGQPPARDGVINPRHDPAAIHGMEDVEQDAR